MGELKVQPDSRQIPSVKVYTADKRYHDLLYAMLQQMSYSEVIDGETNRYVNSRDFSFQSLGESIGIGRVTASKKFKSLIDMGLIEEDKEMKRYKLNYLDASVSALVPFDTLRKMNNGLSHNAISLYVYLLKRYFANNQRQYMVTMAQMKEFVGMTVNTASNNIIITDILCILNKLGLIEFEYKMDDELKNHIYISRVNNRIV